TGALPIELLAFIAFARSARLTRIPRAPLAPPIGVAPFRSWPSPSPSLTRNPRDSLLALPMSGVFPTEPAVLAEFQPVRRLLLVFRRAVIATLALLTSHRDDVPHD